LTFRSEEISKITIPIDLNTPKAVLIEHSQPDLLYSSQRVMQSEDECVSKDCYECAVTDGCKWSLGACELETTVKKTHWYMKINDCPLKSDKIFCPGAKSSIKEDYDMTIKLPYDETPEYTTCAWEITNYNERQVTLKITKLYVTVNILCRIRISL
jgi:hypothetical protein